MKNILISHETPIELLEVSRCYNDYDYCLVHLLPQESRYLDFFKKSKQLGRRILLDNSMFELKEAFDAQLFAKWVEDIQPYEYIVPDVYIDAEKTISNFNEWLKEYNHLPGKKIGVIQGNTYKEFVECYKFMSSHADKIAISFDNPFFMSIGIIKTQQDNRSRWNILMNARQLFINQLNRDGIWNINKPHHLLGCSLPQEFGFYTNFDGIESIDTSNPIIMGMHGVRYTEKGVNDKITTLLADLINAKIEEHMKEDIYFNIKMFKKINNII